MSTKPPREGNFLRRWSHRKRAAARDRVAAAEEATTARPGDSVHAPAVAGAASVPSTPAPLAAGAGLGSVTGAAAAAKPPTVASPPTEATATPSLPPVGSLTFDSDFTAYLKPEVDESLRRQALRKLFADPRFNVMDGLDVYIDDYSKADPIPPDILAQLRHARDVLDPPKTRVNAQGFVEDVPDEEVAGAGAPVADAESPAAEREDDLQRADERDSETAADAPAAAATDVDAPAAPTPAGGPSAVEAGEFAPAVVGTPRQNVARR